MMQLTDIAGLAGIAFAIAALALHLPVVARLHGKLLALLAAALLLAAVLPLGGLSAAEYVRGVTGDLSITTLVLLGFALHTNFFTAPDYFGGEKKSMLSNANSVLLLIVIGALALYPFALGIGMVDPYRLGFGDHGFIAGLLVLALLAWLLQCTRIALCVSLAVLAWSVGWYESNNLWDYLIDPWVSIYAMGVLVKLAVMHSLRRIKQHRRG